MRSHNDQVGLLLGCYINDHGLRQAALDLELSRNPVVLKAQQEALEVVDCTL